MQRDRAKKAKATAKRERRQERQTETDAATAAPDEQTVTGARLSEAEVIDRLERLHQRFDDGAISFDEFEEQKAALIAHLTV